MGNRGLTAHGRGSPIAPARDPPAASQCMEFSENTRFSAATRSAAVGSRHRADLRIWPLFRRLFLTTGPYCDPTHPPGAFQMSKIVAFLKNESGATAIEYGLIAAGISVAIIAVVNTIGTKLNTNFSSISTQLK